MNTKNDKKYFIPYDDDYPNCERTLATLQIYSGEISPDRVTDLLNIEPTATTYAGAVVKSERTGRTRVQKLNGWYLSSENEVPSRDLRRHLDWLLDQVYPQRDAIQRVQSIDGVRMRITCVWWSAVGDGGPVLWPAQMAKMAELDLECSFEFADYSDDNQSHR